MLDIDVTRIVHQLQKVVNDSDVAQTDDRDERLKRVSTIIGAYVGRRATLQPGTSAMSVYNSFVFANAAEFINKINKCCAIDVNEAMDMCKYIYCRRWNMVWGNTFDSEELIEFIYNSLKANTHESDYDRKRIDELWSIVYDDKTRHNLNNLMASLYNSLTNAQGFK